MVLLDTHHKLTLFYLHGKSVESTDVPPALLLLSSIPADEGRLARISNMQAITFCSLFAVSSLETGQLTAMAETNV